MTASQKGLIDSATAALAAQRWNDAETALTQLLLSHKAEPTHEIDIASVPMVFPDTGRWRSRAQLWNRWVKAKGCHCCFPGGERHPAEFRVIELDSGKLGGDDETHSCLEHIPKMLTDRPRHEIIAIDHDR